MALPVNVDTLIHGNIVESTRIEFKEDFNPLIRKGLFIQSVLSQMISIISEAAILLLVSKKKMAVLSFH